MKKLFIVTAPNSSTQKERDGLVAFLTKHLNCAAVCLLESWKVEAYDAEVDPVADDIVPSVNTSGDINTEQVRAAVFEALQVITGTMVLVASETASPQEREDAVGQACAVHQGPVVVLPHGWTAMPVELVRAQLDAIEAIHKDQSIGPSKPPPPPPPPS
jgi:hypothetical protein